MNIGNAQHPPFGSGGSQTLAASFELSRSSVQASGPGGSLSHTQIEGSFSILRQDGDSLQLTEIDFSFARTVLQDSLQDRLDAAFEEAGIDIDTGNLLDDTLDVSPEATATRIVEFATGFLDSFEQQRPEQAPSQRLDDFSGLIRNAVAEGFAQAQDFLRAFQPSEEVQADIDRTFRLVMEGIERFAERRREAIDGAEEAAKEDPSPEQPQPIDNDSLADASFLVGRS